MASDRAKWGNYVHSYISGSQGVNITLFFFSVVIVIVIVIVYVVSVSVVFFFFLGGGGYALFLLLFFCCFFFFCSTLCSSTVTIDVSVIHVRKYLLLEQHFNNLSIFFLSLF